MFGRKKKQQEATAKGTVPEKKQSQLAVV